MGLTRILRLIAHIRSVHSDSRRSCPSLGLVLVWHLFDSFPCSLTDFLQMISLMPLIRPRMLPPYSISSPQMSRSLARRCHRCRSSFVVSTATSLASAGDEKDEKVSPESALPQAQARVASDRSESGLN